MVCSLSLEVEEYSASTAVFFELQPRMPYHFLLHLCLPFLIQVCPRLQTLSMAITPTPCMHVTSAYTEFPAT